MIELPKLFELAMKVQSVPATSAPVERVFSHGGIIMRPHRARLNDTMLSNIVFLKCNADNMDMDIWTSWSHPLTENENIVNAEQPSVLFVVYFAANGITNIYKMCVSDFFI